jgi:cysteine dioxygenase
MLLSSSSSTAAFPQTPAPYEPPTAATYNFVINTQDPLSFADVVSGIRAILGPSSGLDAAEVDVAAIMALLRAYDAGTDTAAWDRYALADPSRGYTRNGVDECNAKANLLVLVWNPGKGSLIHDHANAHCVMKILQGRLVETLYDWPEPAAAASSSSEGHAMHVRKETTLHEGDVAYMADTLGLHRMTNPDPTMRAVSLHLYTPPHAARFGCRIFNEKSGQASHVKMNTLFSNNGVRVHDSMTKGGDSC